MFFRIFTVFAVAALAISTWILSSPARRPSNLSAAKQADLPGYFLKNAILTDYDQSGTPSIRSGCTWQRGAAVQRAREL
jgi:lipopolysaccharide export system protein LptC